MTEKIDFKKKLDGYQARECQFRIVDIPDTQYLMVDGHGDPNIAPAYRETGTAKNRPVSLDAVRLESLTEGRCVQTLHVGSFDNEGVVLEHMHNDFIPENGLSVAGKHHEIYFSDCRRVSPNKLRTILRQPVLPR